MNKTQIKKEIKRLNEELDKVPVQSAQISNIEDIRKREVDIFEADGIQFADDKIEEEMKRK
jgi:hypothetical protein